MKIKTINSDLKGNVWAGSEGKGIFVLGRTTRDSITIDTSIIPFRIDTVSIQYDTIATSHWKMVCRQIGFEK